MDNNFASSIDSKHRHPRSLAAALAGAAARLWLCGISSAGQLRPSPYPSSNRLAAKILPVRLHLSNHLSLEGSR